MSWFRLSLVVMVASCIGCARERPKSPAALDDMSLKLFADFEDPLESAIAVDGLVRWLSNNADSDEAWDGYRLSNLSMDEIDFDLPAGTKLGNHRGIATAGISNHPVERYAEALTRQDQTWADPKSFERYRRTVIEGDADAFEVGESLMRTNNDILKSGAFGVEIPYELRKDYRWVDGAIVARGWLEKTGCNKSGKNCVLQSFAQEVFAPTANGNKTLRLYEVWIEVVTEADGFIGEDAKIGLIAKGNQDVLERTEENLK